MEGLTGIKGPKVLRHVELNEMQNSVTVAYWLRRRFGSAWECRPGLPGWLVAQANLEDIAGG